MQLIPKDQWDKIRPVHNPFLDFNFIDCLINSSSVSAEKGWHPYFIQHEGSGLLTFVKSHSYGEYIFDWAWADAFAKHGIPYYPKLTSMMPFTPVTTTHFIMPKYDEEKADSLLKMHDQFYQQNNFSSAHFLFLTPEEINVFATNNYLIRESIQYHFFNQDYIDFGDFLKSIKTKKAKNIRNERKFPDLKIQRFTGEDLTSAHAKRMYQFYISTIENKNSIDYLNESFFEMIFKSMSKNILYIEASKAENPIAGSLFFYDQEKIYGRYWGALEFIPSLHFELCYYQGIDFCIDHHLKVFEAGAQGEHKIARGFRPIRTYSAHKIKNPAFQIAISDFIHREKVHVEASIQELSQFLPFR